MTTRNPYGTEFATFKAGQAPDLDPTFAALSGQETILQAVLRSWLTPTNTTVRGEGEDIRSYCQMRTSATNRARCKQRLERQATRDERVARAEVEVLPTSNGIRVIGRIYPRAGAAFRLVVAADELTARLDSVSPIET